MAFSFSPSAGKALFALKSKESSSSLHGRPSNDNTNSEQNSFSNSVISSTARRQLSSGNTDAFCSAKCQGKPALDICRAHALANAGVVQSQVLDFRTRTQWSAQGTCDFRKQYTGETCDTICSRMGTVCAATLYLSQGLWYDRACANSPEAYGCACLYPTCSCCTNTDGSTLHSSDCQCSTEICTSSTGRYCHSSLNDGVVKCAPAPCSNTDGLTLNSMDCQCSTETCTSSTGRYCHSSLNDGAVKCSSGPPCSNIDGILPNDVTCTCGLEICAPHKFCLPGTTIPSSYPKKIIDATNCLEIAKSKYGAKVEGKTLKISEKGWDDIPAGCSVKTGGDWSVYFNTNKAGRDVNFKFTTLDNPVCSHIQSRTSLFSNPTVTECTASNPSSCTAWYNDRAARTNGGYLLDVPLANGNVAINVTVYCHDMEEGSSPTQWLVLPKGGRNNLNTVGKSDQCKMLGTNTEKCTTRYQAIKLSTSNGILRLHDLADRIFADDPADVCTFTNDNWKNIASKGIFHAFGVAGGCNFHDIPAMHHSLKDMAVSVDEQISTRLIYPALYQLADDWKKVVKDDYLSRKKYECRRGALNRWETIPNTNIPSGDLIGCSIGREDIRLVPTKQEICKLECVQNVDCVAVVFHPWGTMLKRVITPTSTDNQFLLHILHRDTQLDSGKLCVVDTPGWKDLWDYTCSTYWTHCEGGALKEEYSNDDSVTSDPDIISAQANCLICGKGKDTRYITYKDKRNSASIDLEDTGFSVADTTWRSTGSWSWGFHEESAKTNAGNAKKMMIYSGGHPSVFSPGHPGFDRLNSGVCSGTVLLEKKVTSDNICSEECMGTAGCLYFSYTDVDIDINCKLFEACQSITTSEGGWKVYKISKQKKQIFILNFFKKVSLTPFFFCYQFQIMK